MNKKIEKNNDMKEKETWRVWDALFFSSTVSIIKDSEDARKDTKMFKHLFLSWLFAIVFTVIFFLIFFLIVF